MVRLLIIAALVCIAVPTSANAYINGSLPGESRSAYERRMRSKAADASSEYQQKLNAALAPYHEAIGRNPQDGVAYYQRGLVYERFSAFKQAIADYDKAIEYAPDFGRSYYRRHLLEDRWNDGCPRDYSKLEMAVKLSPDFVPAVAELSRALILHATKSQFDQAELRAWALDLASQACTLTHHTDPICLVILANAQSACGEHARAAQTLKRADAMAVKCIRADGSPSYLIDVRVGIVENEKGNTHITYFNVNTRRISEYEIQNSANRKP
jgi:tetratricopeptide (TPR) repeat protein